MTVGGGGGGQHKRRCDQAKDLDDKGNVNDMNLRGFFASSSGVPALAQRTQVTMLSTKSFPDSPYLNIVVL